MIRNAACLFAVVSASALVNPVQLFADWSIQAFPVKTHNFGTVAVSSKTEFRFPIYRQFRGIVFYDAGNVYARFQDFHPTDVRHVLGAGLRYDMPLGPLRLEYGHKLDRRPGESAGEVFFAIGAAF